MKIKQYVSITNTEAFLKGDWDSCFTIHSYKTTVPEWINAFAEVEFEVPANAEDRCKESMLATLDKQEEELRAKLNLIEMKKNELLALEYKGDI